jgi:hypothetical protein
VHLPSHKDERTTRGEDGDGVDPPQGLHCTAGGVREELSRPPLPGNPREDMGGVESPRRGAGEGEEARDEAADALLAVAGVTRPRVNTLPLAGLSER